MTALSITGATVVVDGHAVAATLTIDGTRITGVVPAEVPGANVGAARVVDATGLTIVPGFVDVQFNGAMGIDFTLEPERVDDVARLLPAMGVTSFLPTVISTSPRRTARAIEVLHAHRCGPRGTGARSLGTHLEGPFLEPRRRGAHPPQHIRPPSLEESSGWSAATGVALVTLAPELDGALEVITGLVAAGVVVCAGHTAADAVALDRAVAVGLRGATHLYNAMGPLNAREPGPAGAVLAHPSVIAGLIVDGYHVDPVMVRIAWTVLGPGRIALVTDAMAALGLPPGRSRVGDTEVIVDGEGVRTADGIIAGSILRMDQAFRNLIAFTGCSVAHAAAAAATTPAALLGRTDLGAIRPGLLADLTVLDAQHQVVATIIDGEVVHDPLHHFDA